MDEYSAFACWPLLAFEMKNMSNDKKINSGLYERLLRASYEPLLLGDNSLIKSLGFEPKYQIKETLQCLSEQKLRIPVYLCRFIILV
jgi:hypothetical protein